MRGRKAIHLLTAGETRTIPEWSRKTGISRWTILARIKRGWTPEEAIGRSPRQRPARDHSPQSMSVRNQRRRAAAKRSGICIECVATPAAEGRTKCPLPPDQRQSTARPPSRIIPNHHEV